MKYFCIYLFAINLTAFALMGRDKSLARRRRRRIPEKTLFLPVLLGGGPGGWLGMYVFHHKTSHIRPAPAARNTAGIRKYR